MRFALAQDTNRQHYFIYAHCNPFELYLGIGDTVNPIVPFSNRMSNSVFSEGWHLDRLLFGIDDRCVKEFVTVRSLSSGGFVFA